jgi:DNA recombination protein RmuC
MAITIVFCVIALLGGAVVGWLAGSANGRRRVADAEKGRIVAETRLAALLENDERVEHKFVALAQRAFAQTSESLVQMNKTQVDGSLDTKTAGIEMLLKPLRDMVEQYRGELVKSERSRMEAYGGLQEQIRALLGVQESAQREASRLANALQSPTVRGSWGESSLKRCVELAGLSEFCDFDLQETFANDEGRRLRPDLIVRLPNQRVIAVDAKVPLSEYQSAANEADEGRKRELLQQHARMMRRHIDTLAKRDYQSAVGETLDFTVMFLPGEHFLSAGLVTDPALFEYAVEKKIYLASPTVLLPLLRAVAAGWKAERTEENAKRMHDAGVELFNRFVKVMELMSDLGATLGKTVEKYNGVIRSIDSRLWPKGEEMQRMAGSGKELAALAQIDAVPLESSKLRLTMQSEEPGDVVPFEK